MKSIFELLNLHGRFAMVTGAGGYIGKVASEVLAELGSNLILVDLKGSNLSNLSLQLEKKWNIQVMHFYCDLELIEERSSLISNIYRATENLDILINNAAFTGSSDLQGWAVNFQNQSVKTFQRAIEVNLTSIFDLSKGLAQLMLKSNYSTIINMASIYGVLAPDWKLYENTNLGNPAAYGVSKAGVIYLTKWLSSTLAPRIRVNSISPGGIFRNQPSIFVERYSGKTPLQRMATENDLRGSIAFLASDMSQYITGQNICIDGGISVI